MKKKIRVSTILNIILVLAISTYTYSWMITEPSYGEIIDYERDLIVSSLGLDVDVYIYEDTDYVMYEEEDIVIKNMAPNDTIRFKFVIKNTNKVATSMDIVFANIDGDISELAPYLTIECSSPMMFTKNLYDDLEETSTYDGLEISNYMKFYNDFKVDVNSENVIYWTIKLDKMADNSIVDKTLTIENIIFLNS